MHRAASGDFPFNLLRLRIHHKQKILKLQNFSNCKEAGVLPTLMLLSRRKREYQVHNKKRKICDQYILPANMFRTLTWILAQNIARNLKSNGKIHARDMTKITEMY